MFLLQPRPSTSTFVGVHSLPYHSFGQFCNESHVSVLEGKACLEFSFVCFVCSAVLHPVLIHQDFNSVCELARGVSRGKNGQPGQFWHYD